VTSRPRIPFWLTFGLIVVAIEAMMAFVVWRSAPAGTQWLGGSIQNTSDVAVYLSYLRQGADGHFLLSDRFAVEPHAQRFDPVWSIAGFIAQSGIPLILLHEILRWVFTLILAWTVFAAARELTKTERDAKLGTILVFGGVSFGWLYSVWLDVLHLWTPTTYAAADVVTEFGVAPVLMGGAHMILSVALLLTSLRLAWRAWERSALRDGIGAAAAACLLASFHPYFALTFGIFEAICVFRFRKNITRKTFLSGLGLSILAAIPALLIYIPLAFDNVFRTHHLDENILPLPPLISWIFVLAPFIGAFIWMRRSRVNLLSNSGWLVAWIVAAVICMAFPLPWTRKYLEGLGPALILLTLPAWLAVRDWILRQQPRILSRTVAALLLLLACLTPLHLIASQIAWIGPDPERQKWFYMSNETFDAWTWLSTHTPTDAIVLSDDMWTNDWTPAYTDRRVWVGHDHETPDFWNKRALWNELMTTQDPSRAHAILDATPVTDLLLVTTSTQATYPGWLTPTWHTAYQTEHVLILERNTAAQ